MCTQHLLIYKKKSKIIIILHECKKSRDVGRLLRVKSTQPKFDKENIEGKSIMNSLYEDDIENEFQRNVYDIKEQNINVQIKLNPEQINIEYLLCNTIIKTYVTEITKHL
jgi:hypothetical protein